MIELAVRATVWLSPQDTSAMRCSLKEGLGRVGRGGTRGLSGEEIKGKSTFR